jgi:hypothetical protein
MLGCARESAQTPGPPWPSPQDDSCVPTPPGSQAACEPQPVRMPRWRPGCGPRDPADDEIEVELTHTGSMVCLGGHVIATGAHASAWTEGRQDVCIAASPTSDRWGGLARGMIVYFVPVGQRGTTLEAQITCYYVPAPSDDASAPD